MSVEERSSSPMEVRIGLLVISASKPIAWSGTKLTAHLWPVFIFAVASQVTTMPTSHPMSVQSIFPLPDFSKLFVAVLVVFVVVRSRWIINVIPILRYNGLLFVRLPLLFPSTPLAFLARIGAVDIIVVSIGRPVCESSLRRGQPWCCS